MDTKWELVCACCVAMADPGSPRPGSKYPQLIWNLLIGMVQIKCNPGAVRKVNRENRAEMGREGEGFQKHFRLAKMAGIT